MIRAVASNRSLTHPRTPPFSPPCSPPCGPPPGRSSDRAASLSRPIDPLDAMMRWPADRPMVCLHSGRLHERWATTSMLAEPAGWLVHQQGRSAWISATGGAAPPWLPHMKHDPLCDLDRALTASRAGASHAASGSSGWIGYLSYDLFRGIEPSAQCNRGAVDDRDWPDFALAWCPRIMRFDVRSGVWSGEPDAQGRTPSRILPQVEPLTAAIGEEVEIGELRGGLSPDEHLDCVSRIIDYIAAGDVFQVNLTRRLSASLTGSVRRFGACALRTSQAWYGAHLELPGGRTILSMSPELFLHVDGATGEVITRPIKGTRRASGAGAASSEGISDLTRSEKDAAELHMIVDLMRNDLGRVCEFGTIRVRSARDIEEHPTIVHGVAEVGGSLRPGTSLADLLRSAFPPGSVTGAPKIRAMQIIDELEPVRRGPYCGAIGFFGCDGSLTLNVAIRTASITGQRPANRYDLIDGTLDYSSGGGVVADSSPLGEYLEAMDKTAILQRVLAQL